jgi:hypothetical protein
MAKTYEQINAGAKELRQRLLNQEKKGRLSRAYTWMKESTPGRVLYSTLIVGSLVAVAEYHGALNSKKVQDTVNNTTYHISSVIEHNKDTIVDFVDRMGETKAAQDLENDMDHLGKMLYSKKQAYEDVLKKDPDNKKVQLELQRLEGVINTYEQNANQNQ